MQKNCKYCGKVFNVKPSAYDIKFYCSKACMAADYKIRMRGENNPNYKQEKDKICPTCGKAFHPNNNNTVYCSFDCYTNSEQKRIDAKRANDGNRLPNNYCKKCGTEISSRRKLCDKCKQPQPKRIGKCLNCGKEVASTYDVQYCKDCRSKGLHKKEVYSICSNCGLKIPNKRYRKYCDFCFGEKMRIWRGTPRKKDENQDVIVEALIKYGCSVIDTSAVGGGFPDLILGKNGVTLLFEIKNPRTNGKLNELQKKWFKQWQGRAFVVYTVEEAIKIVDEYCNRERS